MKEIKYYIWTPPWTTIVPLLRFPRPKQGTMSMGLTSWACQTSLGPNFMSKALRPSGLRLLHLAPTVLVHISLFLHCAQRLGFTMVQSTWTQAHKLAGILLEAGILICAGEGLMGIGVHSMCTHPTSAYAFLVRMWMVGYTCACWSCLAYEFPRRQVRGFTGIWCVGCLFLTGFPLNLGLLFLNGFEALEYHVTPNEPTIIKWTYYHKFF